MIHGHVVVVDDERASDGWGFTCIPHGRYGGSESRTEAFLRALEHDKEHGGTTT